MNVLYMYECAHMYACGERVGKDLRVCGRCVIVVGVLEYVILANEEPILKLFLDLHLLLRLIPIIALDQIE